MAKRKTTAQRSLATTRKSIASKAGDLLMEIRDLISGTRDRVASSVNALLVLLYWEIGHRVRTEVLKSSRAAHGEAIVSTLSAQLAMEFGDGFSKRNLFRMIRFAEVLRPVTSCMMRFVTLNQGSNPEESKKGEPLTASPRFS